MDGTVLLIDYSEYEREKVKITFDNIGEFNFTEIDSMKMYYHVIHDLSNFSLIIIDISFPSESEGFEVISSLRKNAVTSNTPIIIITKSDNIEYKKYALKFNVSDFIIKPYQTKRLENSIRSTLKIENKFSYNLNSANVITMSVEDYIAKEFKIASRANQNLSIVFITHIDINKVSSESKKTLSHSQKEKAYQMAIEKVKSASRSTDTVIFNDGKDILVILPFTNAQGADKVMIKIKDSLIDGLNSLNLPNDYFYTVHTTFPHDGKNFQALMEKALKIVEDKIMLEKITYIGLNTLDHARKSYKKFN
uniref:response regulator n=1 Tax=Acetivibrio cellulolyticus TaxID=35830 RepID=UPI000474E66D|nr:response regulator [Acetivibrio cellulolyticus]